MQPFLCYWCCHYEVFITDGEQLWFPFKWDKVGDLVQSFHCMLRWTVRWTVPRCLLVSKWIHSTCMAPLTLPMIDQSTSQTNNHIKLCVRMCQVGKVCFDGAPKQRCFSGIFVWGWQIIPFSVICHENALRIFFWYKVCWTHLSLEIKINHIQEASRFGWLCLWCKMNWCHCWWHTSSNRACSKSDGWEL